MNATSCFSLTEGTLANEPTPALPRFGYEDGNHGSIQWYLVPKKEGAIIAFSTRTLIASDRTY